MAELIIARVNESGIRARDLSETLSSKHELVLIGQQANIGGQTTASLDGYSLMPSNTQGLCCIHIADDLTVKTRQTFNFGTHTASQFKTWLDGTGSGIVVMVSHTSNVTNSTLNSLMSQYGATQWQYAWDASTGSDKSSFTAIWDCKIKKFMSYQLLGHGTSEGVARLSVQFDTFADIGVTGYGDPVVFDPSDRIGSGTLVHEYVPMTSLASLGLSVYEALEIYCELWQDGTNDNTAVVRTQFYTNGIQISEGTVEVKLDQGIDHEWRPKRVKIDIPDTANEFKITFGKTNSTASSHNIGCRDFVLKTAKPSIKKTQTGSFGQWGFITEQASENLALPNIASSQGQSINAFRYGNFGTEHYGRLVGNSYYEVPEWFPSDDFEIGAGIMWDVSVNQLMLNGNQDIYFGIQTEFHPNGEGHVFKIGEQQGFIPELIRYGDTYTYRLVYKNGTVSFYIDGELKAGPISIQRKPEFKQFCTGAMNNNGVVQDFCLGAIFDGHMLDHANPANNRYYRLTPSGVIPSGQSITGRSNYSGTEYNILGTAPTAVNMIYSGVGSSITPYGTQAGDTVFVTVMDWGGETPEGSWDLNTRYKCEVAESGIAGYTATNKFVILNPDGYEQWIEDGDIANLSIRVEYTAHPEADLVQHNIHWIPSFKQFVKFDGFSTVDLDTSYSNVDFQVKVVRESTNEMYIMSGGFGNDYIRVLTDGTIVPSASISTAGTTRIDRINGEDFVYGMKMELGIPYTLTGRSANLEYLGQDTSQSLTNNWRGLIWDLSITGLDYERYYPGWIQSPFPQYGTTFAEVFHDREQVHKVINLNDWQAHSSVDIKSRRRYEFNTRGTATGVFLPIDLYRKNFRIEYDITCEQGITINTADSIGGSSTTLKILNAGRWSGSVSGRGLMRDTANGIYLRTDAPVIGGSVQINKFVIYIGGYDGVMTNYGQGYYYRSYDEPNVKTLPRRLWTPAFGTGFITIPKWKPLPENFRIHVKCRVPVPTESAAVILGSTTTNRICLDAYTDGKTIRLYGTNAQGTIPTLSVQHGKKAGDIIDIDVLVKNRNVTLSVGSVSTTGTWTGTGVEQIDQIGAQGTMRYPADIHLVELIDTTTEISSTRTYDLRRSTNIKPTVTTVQYPDKHIKTLKLGKGAGYNGWDKSVYPEVGFLKDTHYVDGYKLSKITYDSTNGLIVKFNTDEYFTTFGIHLYETNPDGTQTLKASYDLSWNATLKAYRCAPAANLAEWFNDSNINKTNMVVLEKYGPGSNIVLTNFASADVAWRETVY